MRGGRVKPLREIVAFVSISIMPRSYYPEVLKRIKEMEEVEEIYGVTGEYDLLLRIKVNDMKTFSERLGLISSLRGVSKTYTMLVVDAIKERP